MKSVINFFSFFSVFLFFQMHSDIIHVPIAHGELIDKITILEIKRSKMIDENQLKNVSFELEKLYAIVSQYPELMDDTINVLKVKLRMINRMLWDIEDLLREAMRAKRFDSAFVTLAQLIPVTNHARCEIKNEINRLCSSKIVEEKMYSTIKNNLDIIK